MKQFLLFLSITILVVFILKADSSTIQIVRDNKLDISMNNNKIATYTLEELKKMPLHSVNIEGRQIEGVQVLSLLKQHEINNFSELIFKNKGVDRLNLKRAEVDEDTIVEFTNNNTIQVVEKKAEMKNWVRNLHTIEIIK